MLNVAVIGMGVGAKHASVYLSDERCNLICICDFDSKKKSYLKQKFPNTKYYENDSRILNSKNIDLVSIASYDNYHSKQILKAIENDIHVMVEKPICLNKKELEKIIIALSKKKSLKLSANFVLRSNKQMVDLKKNIANSNFGDLYFMEADYFWGRHAKLNGWRAEMDFYSIILGAAIHMIDLIMWMLSEKPITVYAIGNRIGSNKTKLKYNSFAILILKFPNDLLVKITGNGPCVHPHFHSLKIFGTDGTFIHDYNESFLLKDSSPIQKKIISKNQKKYVENKNDIITSFIDSILNPVIPQIVKSGEIFNVMSVCFAAEESMKTGKVVEISY